MKKIVSNLAAMLLCIMQAAAQTGCTVTSFLKEKVSDLPMEYATVVLYGAETKKCEKRRNPRIFYLGVSWQFGGNKGKKHNANLEYDEGL